MQSVKRKLREVRVGVLSHATLPQFCKARHDILDVEDVVYRRIAIEVRDDARRSINNISLDRPSLK